MTDALKTTRTAVCDNCGKEMTHFSDVQGGFAAEDGKIPAQIQRIWRCRHCGYKKTEPVSE